MGSNNALITSQLPANKFYSNNLHLSSIYLERLTESTTEVHIREAFKNKQSNPASIKMFERCAFVNFDSKVCGNYAMGLRSIMINGHTYLITAEKNCDHKNIKAVIGFWSGCTTHVNKLYTHINKHVA
jgi:hypothetical protein